MAQKPIRGLRENSKLRVHPGGDGEVHKNSSGHLPKSARRRSDGKGRKGVPADVQSSLTNDALKSEVELLRSQVATYKHRYQEAVETINRAAAVKFKAGSFKPRPKLKGDFVEVIVSDIHGNKHDPAAFAAFEADLKVINPNRVFLGGDIMDCGGFLAEHHTLGYVAETEDSYEEDLAATNSILNRIQSAAKVADIHYQEGNHEFRVERWAVTQKLSHHKDVEMLRRTFCPEHRLGLAERGITYYRQGLVHPKCSIQGWVYMDNLFYVHKISNAVDAGRVAVNKTGANVAFFDTHRSAFSPKKMPGAGLIAAWNPGCLCKLQPLYANTNPTGWTHGYLVRFVSRTGLFQMVNISIEKGVSFGQSMFKH